jgi:hypothetical protein
MMENLMKNPALIDVWMIFPALKLASFIVGFLRDHLFE